MTAGVKGGGAEGSGEEHQRPAVRAVEVLVADGASCGFHLTRTRWDPYPWVCGVDDGSAAERAGLRVGDCVLEVNGEDVLGLRVSDVAARVRARPAALALLLWNSGVDPDCDPESLCCGPMPTSLQRLSAAMNVILSGLECPVCLDTVPPPAHQCANGHLVCARCRPHTERCPVCRHRLTRGRCLLADRVYNALSDAFRLADEPPESRSAAMRRRLTGTRKMPEVIRPAAEVKPKVIPPKNKFLTRIMGKSSSVENLSTNPKSKPENSLSVESLSANTKAKSLSTSEIFNQCLSPAVSRSSVLTPVTNDVGFTSSHSFQGSLESLGWRMLEDFVEPEAGDGDARYFCPRSPGCGVFAARSVLGHLQRDHCGPLVHYFSTQFATDLPPALPEDGLVTISAGGDIYFLKMQLSDVGDLFVWMWVLGDESKAADLRLVLTLRTSDPDSAELTFKAGVLSLATVSWDDAVGFGRGVTIKRDVVDAMFKGEKVRLYVSLASKATPV